MEDIAAFEKRKQDHIQLALKITNEATEMAAFESVILEHEALPPFNFEEVSIASTRFGESIRSPFLISSMTAGHEQAPVINARLMEAASEASWIMGVGSQRRELFDAEAKKEWQQLRQTYPKLDLLSNIGIAQAIVTPIDTLKALLDNINAKGLIIHCNALQEVIQKEGTPQFKGAFAALENLVKHLPLPLVIKETGCGFSLQTLKRLEAIGVTAVDVAGLGGTHWGRIEGDRASASFILKRAAETFKNWGIDTVTAIKSAAALNPRFEIWGSGGVRTGLDAAKLCALGATTVGFAKPLLEAALVSSQAVFELMQAIEYELKIALFCTGSLTLTALKEKICR